MSGGWIHQVQEILAEHEPSDVIFQVSSQPGARTKQADIVPG
jgi:hypothetical protein